MKTVTAIDYWRASIGVGFMLAEAQTVIALRLLGMAGLWNVGPRENDMMVAEKHRAFGNAGQAMALALWQGVHPALAMEAAMKPVRSRTRSNVRRLTKRGPMRP